MENATLVAIRTQVTFHMGCAKYEGDTTFGLVSTRRITTKCQSEIDNNNFREKKLQSREYCPSVDRSNKPHQQTVLASFP